jgi:hypothetical protein
MRVLALVPALIVLAACQKADNQPGPGGVTVGEAKALDEAAEMIEDQRLTRDALPSPAAPARSAPAAKAASTPSAKPAG